jgi:hypothetical protein
MVVTSIFWMMNELKHVPWIKDLLFPFIQSYLDSYVSFETFLWYGFSKLSPHKYSILKKKCKYISPQKPPFLIQNMTLKKQL